MKKNKQEMDWTWPEPLPPVPPLEYPMIVTGEMLALLLKHGHIEEPEKKDYYILTKLSN